MLLHAAQGEGAAALGQSVGNSARSGAGSKFLARSTRIHSRVFARGPAMVRGSGGVHTPILRGCRRTAALGGRCSPLRQLLHEERAGESSRPWCRRVPHSAPPASTAQETRQLPPRAATASREGALVHTPSRPPRGRDPAGSSRLRGFELKVRSCTSPQLLAPQFARRPAASSLLSLIR